MDKEMSGLTVEQVEDEVYVHIKPLPVECEHEWPLEDEHGTAMDQCCPKCGMSFIRYIHTECP